ncbi:hypothetical protein SteCoe_36651 [Stentor coeruleus]|uniref:EF-hand domain-containing protein n=1 Tax=Stentor coeruleus TaxID=5963 RepID=A0A1R2APK8_9CILI|nr:hypothetical protein SteCoe_36651 [Stentor coeruleus]
MGCEFTRDVPKNYEELTIQAAESLLGFEAIECGEFDMSFSRFAHGNYLTEKQLKASLEALGLTGSSVDEFPFKNYLSSFQEDDKGYPLKKLVCVGILLGKGTPSRKGELLLQNYDRDCSGEIDPDEFKCMIDDMILVSVIAAIDLAKHHDTSMINLLENYLKKLKKAQKIFFIYVHFIMSMGKENEPITNDNFIKTFEDEKMKMLASTSGIRELALELIEMQSHHE